MNLNTENSDLVDPNDRLEALEKALLLSKLFSHENFKKATDALNKPGDIGMADFLQICTDAGLKVHGNWLWTGLKTAKKDSNSVGTGW